MKTFVLNIEGYIAHHVAEAWGKDCSNLLSLPCWQEALDPFVDHIDCGIHKSREYFLIDFNDFIEYATSGIACPSRISDLPNNHVVFIDALPGSYDASILDSEYGWGFSIVGAAIGKTNNVCSVTLQIRYLNDTIYELDNKYKDSHPPYFSDIHFFPYEFFTLLLTEDGKGDAIEILRYLTQPPILRPHEDYEYGGIFLTRDKDLIDSYGKSASAFLEPSQHANEFEIARLLLHFAPYIDFMYDLIVKEKRPIGKRPSLSKHKDRKNRSLYKIIKSIRVRYDQENLVRRHANQAKRVWIAPGYQYTVSGHWRNYSNPWWKGHDLDGNIILGKTWIAEHTKGEGTDKVTEESSENPQVQIKLKQTLSYARDVIKAHRVETGSNSRISGPSANANESRPSLEWMHYERSKLTAGLRYLILKRDGFSCQLCGANTVEDGVKLEIDHIRPISSWGKTEESNLQTLCNRCNRGKSNQAA